MDERTPTSDKPMAPWRVLEKQPEATKKIEDYTTSFHLSLSINDCGSVEQRDSFVREFRTNLERESAERADQNGHSEVTAEDVDAAYPVIVHVMERVIFGQRYVAQKMRAVTAE